LNFSDKFSKNPQLKHFMTICPVGAELFHVEGWTDRLGEINSRFSQFCGSS